MGQKGPVQSGWIVAPVASQPVAEPAPVSVWVLVVHLVRVGIRQIVEPFAPGAAVVVQVSPVGLAALQVAGPG